MQIVCVYQVNVCILALCSQVFVIPIMTVIYGVISMALGYEHIASKVI